MQKLGVHFALPERSAVDADAIVMQTYKLNGLQNSVNTKCNFGRFGQKYYYIGNNSKKSDSNSKKLFVNVQLQWALNNQS